MTVMLVVPSAIAGLDEDLIVYFSFDKVKGKRVFDGSGNQLNANIIANVDFIKGRYGNALHISGEIEEADCIRVPNDNLLKINGQITMMAWIHFQDWGQAWGHWFDKGCYLDNEQFRSYGMGVFQSIGAFKDQTVLGMLLGQNDGQHLFTTVGPKGLDRWHHITGTYDGVRARIYMDGKRLSNAHPELKFAGDNDLDLYIGCAQDHPVYTLNNGSIDEAAIWKRALTEIEIKNAMTDVFAVSPNDKVTTTWGDLKRSANN